MSDNNVNYIKSSGIIEEHHENVSQKVISITEDRLHIILRDYVESVNSSRLWHTPLALCLTILVVLLTTDFKDAFSVKADTWEAVFLLSFFVLLLWFIKSLYKSRSAMTIGDIIDKTKKS